MIWALFRKELWQHGVGLTVLMVLSGVVYAVVASFTASRGMAGTAFEASRLFIMLLVPVLAFLVGSRLVTTEYSARTQLFLEGLPLPRWGLPAVKYALGNLFLGCLVMACLLSGQLLALRAGYSADLQHLSIMSLRGLAYGWCAFAIFFLTGFLGRYRVALWIVVLTSFALLEEGSDIQWSRFGPFALVDATFAFERDDVPWADLGQTGLLALTSTAVAFALGSIREGSVAGLLAEKMSHREKVFVAALLVCLLWVGTLVSEKTRRTPFDLRDALSATNGPVAVKISARGDPTEVQALANSITEELAAVCEYLGRDSLPPVFITQRGDLDGNRYERGELEQSEGVFVQANVLGPGWNTRHFLAWVTREALIVGTHGRAELETRRWVLDGFSHFWLTRTAEPAVSPERRLLTLRMVYGLRAVDEPEWTEWYRFRERVGDEIAAAVAWSLLRVVEREAGPANCQRFLQAMFGREPAKDFRAVLGMEGRSARKVLEQMAGIGFDQLARAWRQDVMVARRELEPLTFPVITGEVQLRPLSAGSRQLWFQARISPTPPAGTRYSFQHCLLPPLDEVVDPRDTRREEVVHEPGTLHELPEVLSRGARLYSTFGLYVPELQCEVISGWRREEVR